MVLEPLRPARGGFLRPFGCAWFIREFLLGNGPMGSPRIDPDVGGTQTDVHRYYKEALHHVWAEDMVARDEEERLSTATAILPTYRSRQKGYYGRAVGPHYDTLQLS